MDKIDDLTDSTAIKNSISTALVAYPNIAVNVQQGNIILNGMVEDGATIPSIIATATSAAGTSKIINNIEVANIADKKLKMKVNTENSNLNMRKEPSADAEIIAKAGHEEIVTVLKKANADWYLIETEDGEKGYSSTQYLSEV